MPKESQNGNGEDLNLARATLLRELRSKGPPSVNRDGVYISRIHGEDGSIQEQWATRNRAAGILTENGAKISGAGLKQRMNKHCPDHPILEVELENGMEAEAVPLIDAGESVSDLAEITIFLPKEGIYTDEEGRKWAAVSAMTRGFGVAKPAIAERLDGVEKKRARNHRGKPTWIYDFSEVERKISSLTKARKNTHVKVDPNGHYEDEEGCTWATIQAFYDSLPKKQQRKISPVAIRRYAEKKCRYLPALDREERPNAKVYPVEELQALPIFTNEIRVDSNGIYTDSDGEKWASRNTWQEIFRVSQKAMNIGVNKEFKNWENVPSIRGFGLAKREDDLYSREAIEDALSYIFDAENLAVNDVVTVIEETASGIRETLYLSPEELTKIISEDRVPRYKYRRKFEAERIDGIDRNNGGSIATFSLDAVIDSLRDQIQDVLDSIEEAQEGGELISISEYLQKHPRTDRRNLIANTDNIERVRRRKEEKIVYLYKEEDLDEISKAA